MPSSQAEWRGIAQDYEARWNMPHCLGALDGKHITIRKPDNSGSTFINYKQHFSIVLMALVNARYEFLFVDVGVNGRISDGGVFNRCNLGNHMENDKNIPPPEPLPAFIETHPIPYFMVADDAFPLKSYIMKPYPFRSLTPPQRIFNYRLSRARRMVESTFGILANRFRVFSTRILSTPETVDKVVLAACTLHNFISKNSKDKAPRPQVQHEEHTQNSSEGVAADRQPASITQQYVEAKETREVLCRYFSSDVGKVPWQDSMIASERDE